MTLEKAYCQSSQDIEILEIKKSRVAEQIIYLNDSLEKIESEIRRIRLTDLKNSEELVAVAKKSSAWADEGDTVYILDYEWWSFLIDGPNGSGKIPQDDVIMTDKIKLYIENKTEENKREREENYQRNTQKRISDEKSSREKSISSREKSIRTEFRTESELIISRIINRKYWIGMSDKMAIWSIGKPNKINRTITSSKVREQWVYNNLYLYFEDGFLDSIQESK